MSYWSTDCEATQHVSWGAKLRPEVSPSSTDLQAVRRTQLFVHLLRWCGASLPSHLPQGPCLPGSPGAALGSALLYDPHTLSLWQG